MTVSIVDFKTYLEQKKISPTLFQAAEPVRYSEWEALFERMNPDSFTAQKKFLLNNTRRLYLIR